jgi:hypothetical protein
MMLVFLSYKSEDANLVRAVAECLIASGTDVWFNEYRVLPAEYEQFDVEIDRGLRQATHALVFTNNRWSRAQWCQYEMRGLLAHLPGRDNVLEVCIPKEDEPHAVFTELSRLQPTIFRGDSRRPDPGDVERLVGEIQSRLGLHATNSTARPSLGNAITLPRFGIRLDAGPLHPSLGRTKAVFEIEPAAASEVLVLAGPVAGVEVTLDLHIGVFHSAVRDLSVRQAGVSNDRELYLAYLKYAKDWIKWINGQDGRHLEFKGLHLVFVGERSHIGLTYTSDRNTGGQTLWERRYTISVEGDREMEKGEVGLIFGAWLAGSDKEQFETFCRLSPQFEAISQTVRYRSPSGAIAVFSNIPIVIANAAYAVGSGWLVWYLFRVGKPSVILGLACLLAGYCLGYLVTSIVRSLFRRLLWTMQTVADDLSAPLSYERFSTDLLHYLIFAPVAFFGFLMNTGTPWLAAALLYVCLGASRIATEGSPPWHLAAFLAGAVALGGAFAALAIDNFIARARRRGPAAARQKGDAVRH